MVEPLFFDPNLKPAERVTLTGDEAKHAVSVRRMRLGEAVAVTNGKGLKLRGEVIAVERNSMTIGVVEVIEEKLPARQFVLVQALAKGDRDELAIQAATELGVSEIIPWAASRSVSRWEGAKQKTGRDRWQQIVTEAAKQSLRSFIPQVSEVIDSKKLAESFGQFAKVLVLDPTGTKSLSAVSIPESGRIALIVGPEGGISAEELEIFSKAEIISLGSNVLRTSTAGPAVLAALTLG